MLALTVRLVVSLAFVVGLLMVLARLGGRRFRGRADAPMQVLHRQPLGRSSAAVLVSVGGRMLLLGTTEQQVSLLAELDPEDLVEEDEPEEVAVLPVSGALAGSVLSPDTWRRALASVRAGGQAS